MSLTIQSQYKTITNNSQFNLIRQYVTPSEYFDPRKQILDRKNADYKNKPHQKKFKATQRHKNFYLIQTIQPLVPNPSPDKYKTLTNGFFGQSSPDKKDLKRAKSASLLKKVDPKTIRGSYLDDIQKYQAKHKAPGIGKYDITKDPYKKKIFNIKPKQLPIKFDRLDDVKYLSNLVPGTGQYNPHDQVPHLKLNKTDYKFYQTKHNQEQKKQNKAIQTKLGPSTYQPLVANTFDSILKNKSKQKSRWSHGTIDIRKGMISKFKSPSPAQYKLINQWVSNEKTQRQSDLGKVKLFERTSKSTKALSVYH